MTPVVPVPVPVPAAAAHTVPTHGFPRLIGMFIAEKAYADAAVQRQIARNHIAILGFYRGWGERDSPAPMQAAVEAIKRLHPGILLGQYTILNEASGDPDNTAEADKQAILFERRWWLRNAAGKRQQWTSDYGAWDINLTEATHPDAAGRRYPQWLAQRDFSTYFLPVPAFDIWYFDNVMAHPRIPHADWNGTGVDQDGDSPPVARAFRRAQALHWQAARTLAPDRILIGNPDNDLSSPQYSGRLQGAFLEAMMGPQASFHARRGWQPMMQHYHDVTAHLAAPAIVGFHAVGPRDDHRLLRFALASCLMGNAYFAYTDAARGYRDPPWFDEYDADLGPATDPPQTDAWQAGVFRRRFANGMALVNPTATERRVPIEAGYRHLEGSLTRQINSGARTKLVVLPPNDGVLLRRAPS